MKSGQKILCGIGFVLLAAWLAFDPFSKAPIQPDPVGKFFAYICGAFIIVLGWVLLRKNIADDRPDW